MRLRHKHILFFLFLVLTGIKGLAQQGQLQFEHIDINNGLSHNQVNCIFKDEKGFMWFGTLSGLDRYDGYSFKIFRHDMQDTSSLNDNYITGIFPLPAGRLWINTRVGSNIYDPATESFNRDLPAYLQTLSLPPGTINSVVKDKKKRFWFIYEQNGIYRYSPGSENVTHVSYQPNDPRSLSDNDVADIAVDSLNDLWVIQGNGILQKLNTATLKVTYRNDSLLALNGGKKEPYKIFMDKEGDLWIYISGNASGLFYFDTHKRRFYHITTNSELFRLNNNIIDAISQDAKGIIWVGTDHGGINLINKKEGTVRYLMHNPANSKSLAQNSIYSLYQDNLGIMWAGTYKKGICYYNEIFDRFPLYRHDPNLPRDRMGNEKSLPYEDVNRFVEDKKGNLWIGTNGGGLICFNREKGTFKQYLHDPDNPNSLCNNVIVSLYLDSKNNLWVGTYTGGLDRFDGKKFTHFKHDPNDSTSLSNNSVWDIFEDSEDNLWIGTLGGGLERFDPQVQKFFHYKSPYKKTEGIAYVLILTEDKRKNLWIGTAAGLEVLDLKTGNSVLYSHDPNDPNSLSNDNINAVFQDSRGWIWIGTREGFNLFNPSTKQFRVFTTKNGLPDNTILTILEDEQNRLWMSTPAGLSCLTISKQEKAYTFSFKNYNESDGLQGREFNEKSAFKTREGLLIFGGANGFNMFDPAHININKRTPPIAFTDLQIFNKSIRIGDKIRNKVILPKAVSEVASVSIPYKVNDFSIVFAALGYTHTEKNKYAYKLKGFNDEWITSGDKIHKATYTNLDPGDYTFVVKASNNDGIWGKETQTLHIKILPPFWRTPWAYLLYALVIAGLLYLARSMVLYRARMNFKMEHQQHEAQRMHELDMMKMRFFTNISHEFRTPLTLILTPLEKLIKQTPDQGQMNQLKLIQRNAKRLLHLVNQLLDFRKMEVQEIRLQPVNMDIIAFIKEIVYSFTDVAEKKNIHFSLETSIPSLCTDFDPDKLERILFNLLSNAFKFTHEKGIIKVGLDVKTGGEKKRSCLMIRIKDNGIGIPLEKQERIFERFFQHGLPPTIINPGSGIGLSITHEFVRLHHGTISVESTPGKGSCFTVMLPVTSHGDLQENKTNVLSLNNEHPKSSSLVQTRKGSTILLVDDNEDFRFYLKDNLSVYFNILEAANGKEGWKKAIDKKPDLIVSDIMMPEMNGIELSKKLKRDPRTADIPVILLTARATEEQTLEGYETGANDYITKPFNFEILLARIRNLLEEKKRLHKKEATAVTVEPAIITIMPEDEKFLNEARSVVEKNMDNPNFSVEELSTALFISRVTLYKRLSSITGKTPVEFIRMLRIKRAAQLIEKGKKNVSQAAYEVGFNNPKYFTKYFKEEFGVLPSEYGKEVNNVKHKI